LEGAVTTTRREMLAAILGLPAAGWACRRDAAQQQAWDGEDVDDGRRWGHALRDRGELAPAGAEGPTAVDVLVVGGGMSGLAAAWRLVRQGLTDVAVLEAHDAIGGTSRAGRSRVTGYPWGAHYVPVPGPGQPHLQSLLREMDVLVETETGLAPRESARITEPVERSFYRGQWYGGLYPFASEVSRRERARFFGAVDAWVRFRDADGRRAFALPFATSSDEPRVAALDQMTFAEWLDREGFDDPGVRWAIRYASRDDYGTEPEQLSAWYGLAYFAARAETRATESAPFVAWPDGNARIAAHLGQAVGRERVHAGQVVESVRPRGGEGRCRVVSLDRAGTRRTWSARSVVFALPSFVRAYVLPEPLHGAYRPDYAPWIVSNVHLSGRPEYRGFETAWDNVIVDSESLGYVVATHQGGSAFGPTVWTHYIPFSGADARAERERAASLTWDDATDAVFSDLARAHPDLAEHVQRIDVLRWGHGMVRPEPGVAFSNERRRACAAVDGVHFAHTDLSGAALLEEAVHHGVRAADEILAERRSM
jgi:glycine/D-amino acid oxidase-like deaminating enzyme